MCCKGRRGMSAGGCRGRRNYGGRVDQRSNISYNTNFNNQGGAYQHRADWAPLPVRLYRRFVVMRQEKQMRTAQVMEQENDRLQWAKVEGEGVKNMDRKQDEEKEKMEEKMWEGEINQETGDMEVPPPPRYSVAMRN